MDYIKYNPLKLPNPMPELVDVVFHNGVKREGVFTKTLDWSLKRCGIASWRPAQNHNRCGNCGKVHQVGVICECGHNSECMDAMRGRFYKLGEPSAGNVPVPPLVDILHAGKTKKPGETGVKAIEVDWDPTTTTVTYWRPSTVLAASEQPKHFSFKCADAYPASVIEAPKVEQKHSHYFRPCPYDAIDVYRIIEIFSVTDPCIQHAIKKLLVAGSRGHKDITRDVQDVIDTMERWKAMREEESK